MLQVGCVPRPAVCRPLFNDTRMNKQLSSAFRKGEVSCTMTPFFIWSGSTSYACPRTQAKAAGDMGLGAGSGFSGSLSPASTTAVLRSLVKAGLVGRSSTMVDVGCALGRRVTFTVRVTVHLYLEESDKILLRKDLP
jgi:hypothetical protein